MNRRAILSTVIAAGAAAASGARAKSPSCPAPESGLEFETYHEPNGDYRWRLSAANGRLIAASGEGYRRLVDCRRGIEIVKGSFAAPVV